MTINPPSEDVFRAFGAADASPYKVAGGQGHTFRVGSLAIKRIEDAERTEWLGAVMENIREDGFRIARPVRAKSGKFVVDGCWCAAQWIEGSTPAIQSRWQEAISACTAFHRALADVSWSLVLEQLDNPWARADAAIWTDPPLEGIDLGATAARLRQRLAPVILPSQLVQGDPGEGNILFAEGKPPAMIDISPYWYPADYALAMLIADGIAWSGAPLTLLAQVASLPEMDQLLARAVLFRLYVGYLFHGGESGAEGRARAYAPVIEAVEHWPRHA